MMAMLPLFISCSAFAETEPDSQVSFSGFRVGGGVINHESDELIDDATGFVLEAGYDFNRIVGIVGRYSDATFDNDNDQNPSRLPGKVDITTWGLYSDIGYTFVGKNNFQIKPYGLIGIENINAQTDTNQGKFDENEYALALGTGVRATFNEHFVLAAEYKFSSVDIPEYDDLDLDTVSIMVNYKF